MKNIIFIAAPGAGKGTQSMMLSERYNYLHVSTGDLVREEIATGSERGLAIKEIISHGSLVNDDIIFDLLDVKLKASNQAKGIIFDGFPRNLEQAKRYDQIYGKNEMDIDYVIHIDIDKDEAMKRILGRLICSKCGSIYNEYYDKFNNQNHCNSCDSTLDKRVDDNEVTFGRRFDVYLEETKPLIDYYKEQNLLYTVKASDNKEDVFKEIESIIKG